MPAAAASLPRPAPSPSLEDHLLARLGLTHEAWMAHDADARLALVHTTFGGIAADDARRMRDGIDAHVARDPVLEPVVLPEADATTEPAPLPLAPPPRRAAPAVAVMEPPRLALVEPLPATAPAGLAFGLAPEPVPDTHVAYVAPAGQAQPHDSFFAGVVVPVASVAALAWGGVRLAAWLEARARAESADDDPTED